VIKRQDSVGKIATEKDFFERKSSGVATDSLILADSLNSKICNRSASMMLQKKNVATKLLLMLC
jgi:hypothetical protein